MANRECHPMRRVAREEARVWIVALILVVAYMIAANTYQPDTDPAESWMIEDTQ